MSMRATVVSWPANDSAAPMNAIESSPRPPSSAVSKSDSTSSPGARRLRPTNSAM